MQTQGWMMLKVLINRFHKGSLDAFLRPLDAEDAKEALKQEHSSQSVDDAFVRPTQQLTKIHYSWVAPLIEQFPEKLQPMILEALPSDYSANLYKSLNKEKGPHSLSAPMKEFLTGLVFAKLETQKVLPAAYLPSSSLNILAELNKNDLVKIIDYLGLQDLAEATRTIVDKKLLSSIYGILSPQKQRYLQMCIHQTDRLTTPKLELDQWDGNQEKLEFILHRRGLFRFAKVLSGCNPDLFWHIIHALDTGRAAVLDKYYTKEPIPSISPALTQQLINLINFLKRKSTK